MSEFMFLIDVIFLIQPLLLKGLHIYYLEIFERSLRCKNGKWSFWKNIKTRNTPGTHKKQL